jgi:hypothetical protein
VTQLFRSKSLLLVAAAVAVKATLAQHTMAAVAAAVAVRVFGKGPFRPVKRATSLLAQVAVEAMQQSHLLQIMVGFHISTQ